MIRAGAVLLAIACALLATPGCGFAVKHPAVTGGVVAGSLGFVTCKMASDDYAACGMVAGGAGAFLGLAAAVALWLGGDGNTPAPDEPLPPLLEDDPPDERPAPPPGTAVPSPSPPPDAPSTTPPSSVPPSPTSAPSPPSPSPPSSPSPPDTRK